MAIEFLPRLNDANPDPRVACALLLDVSGSMDGDKIDELRNGLQTFCTEVYKDRLARKRTEVLLVTFGGQVNVVQEFIEARDLVPPRLVAAGTTPLGAAILTALERIEARKNQYKDAGLEYFRPWLFILSDGAPTDHEGLWLDAVRRINEAQDRKAITVFTVAAGDDAEIETLAQLSAERAPVRLAGLKFREMFLWLSKSMEVVSNSAMFGPADDAVELAGDDAVGLADGGDDSSGQTPLPSPAGWAKW